MIKIYYDGACPFCKNYVIYNKIKKTMKVELIDLRGRNDLIARFRNLDYDVDNGMVVEVGDNIYYGADAIRMLALFSSNSNYILIISAYIFSKKKLAKLSYPLLVAGRKFTLWILNIKSL